MVDGAILLVDASEGPLPQNAVRAEKSPGSTSENHRRHQQDRP